MGLDTANKPYGITVETVKTNVDLSDGTDFTVKKELATKSHMGLILSKKPITNFLNATAC